MAARPLDYRVAGIVERCYAGLDAAQLRQDVLRRLRRIVPVDAAFFATVDPVTLLFTGAVAEDPLAAATPLFMDNEYGRADVNKFASLAGAADQITSLDRATRGDRPASPRYREIMGPMGLGDELRAALVAEQRCWGVLCLHREDSSPGFSGQELRVVQRIAPHLAEGLRRAVTLWADAGVPVAPDAPGTPGIIVLDANLETASVSPEAEYWLAEIADPGSLTGSGLPVAVYAAAARLTRLRQQPDQPFLPSVRVRTRTGRWLAIHATYLTGPAGRQTAVVFEPASPAQLSSLFLSAYGLTQAQERVATLVLRGQSTRQIVGQLHISAHTVQEHLTAVFDRIGVRSRRELVARLLAGRH
ncbi:MAG TPA: LuxR C-terminal-related transcriptional regulator [Streptosporangiaceae bacterium]